MVDRLMRATAQFWNRAPHLAAGALALLAVAIFQWLVFGPLHLDRSVARALAADNSPIKDEGLACQDAAFHDPELLPVYGSSEFQQGGFAFSGGRFFESAPTGFRVFSVGKAGSKPLLIAERLAALGDDIRGKKVVIILSPTWFFSRGQGAASYESAFSALQASRLIFDGALSLSLKRDFAREMLRFTPSLADHPFLRFTLERLAGSSKLDSEDRLIMDVGEAETSFKFFLDRDESFFAEAPQFFKHPGEFREPKLARAGRTYDWHREFNLAATFAAQKDKDLAHATNAKDLSEDGVKAKNSFLYSLYVSDEWSHLDLLLRTVKHLGAEPFFLSIPINAASFGKVGIDAKAREYYYDRLRAQVAKFGYPLDTFQPHENDPTFFADGFGHPSAKGWMYLNRAIDRFYHDKILAPAGKSSDPRQKPYLGAT